MEKGSIYKRNWGIIMNVSSIYFVWHLALFKGYYERFNFGYSFGYLSTDDQLKGNDLPCIKPPCLPLSFDKLIKLKMLNSF